MRLGDLDALCEVLSNMAAEAFDECEEHTIRGCLGVVQRMPTIDPESLINEELKFTREFIHEHGLEFALSEARNWRGKNG